MPGGTYSTVKTVTVTVATPGATITYTLTGVDPTAADTPIASGSSLTIDQSRTLKARAFNAGFPDSAVTAASYTLQVATPAATPGGGTYTTSRTVTLSSSSPGVSIRYTTDGTTPTDTSALYTAPLTVATATTLKAIGVRSGWTSSGVATATYVFSYGTLAAPVIAPGTGTYATDQSVAITGPAGAIVRYTTDGSEPTTSSLAYADPIAVAGTLTIKAKAFQTDWTPSATTTAVFTFEAAAPVFSLPAGTYAPGTTVTLTSATPGATIHYTLNGAAPTANDPVVNSGEAIALGNFTLRAAAWRTGYSMSGVTTAVYALDADATVPKLATWYSHALALRADGTVWSWGSNTFGGLGDGTTVPHSTPASVAGLSGVVAVAAGSAYSLALATDGTVWAWGYNASGQLGDGSTTVRKLPTRTSSFAPASAIAAGEAHSVALTGDGRVWTWGSNADGQLGDGSTTSRPSPALLETLTDVVGIAAGVRHTLALTADGRVWAWGGNFNGQLGDGTTTSHLQPTLVAALSDVVRIACGRHFSLALKADGTLWAWGANNTGQLGDGTATQRKLPVAVALSEVTAMFAGAHAMALKADGSAWAWGGNNYGQLGDGTTTQRTLPVATTGTPALVEAALGDAHTLALTADGVVWTWGANANGQLGDGTATNRAAPTSISAAGLAWKLATPVFSVAAGSYGVAQTVVITCSTPGATIRVTASGVEPTEVDTVVPSGGAVLVDRTATLMARAWKDGSPTSNVAVAAYTLQPATPSFTPVPSTYTSAQSVAITTTTAGATIRFTTDGTEPTEASQPYESPLSVATTTTIKAKAFKPFWSASGTATATYGFNYGTVGAPVVTPSGGTFSDDVTVTVSAAAGATIRYTTNGAEPTASSPVYVGPVLVDATVTIRARAFLADWTPSATVFSAFTMKVAAPDVRSPKRELRTWRAGGGVSVDRRRRAPLHAERARSDLRRSDAGLRGESAARRIHAQGGRLAEWVHAERRHDGDLLADGRRDAGARRFGRQPHPGDPAGRHGVGVGEQQQRPARRWDDDRAKRTDDGRRPVHGGRRRRRERAFGGARSRRGRVDVGR